MSHLELVAIVVDEYDAAIAFFVDLLGFDLVEDSPALTNDGRPKRWVVVRPPGAETGILLAQRDGDEQRALIGNQTAGRVGFFLRVPDFESAYERMTAAGVEFVSRAADRGVRSGRGVQGHRRQQVGSARPGVTASRRRSLQRRLQEAPSPSR